jgi:sigma-B regulation protein RsbU (phosphoserine phosphatase)
MGLGVPPATATGRGVAVGLPVCAFWPRHCAGCVGACPAVRRAGETGDRADAPGLSLPEVARVVDRSVTRAAGDEDFVTAVFAELDPHGWLQLVICGHPPPLRLSAGGGLQALTPRAYATPLGLHPDIQPSTFTISPGDRLVFYTDGLLEARDRAGRYLRLEDCAGTLRHPDLEAAADGLLGRLLAHTRRKLDDDVALLLLEATSLVPCQPRRSPDHDPAPARRSLAGAGRPSPISGPRWGSGRSVGAGKGGASTREEMTYQAFKRAVRPCQCAAAGQML